MQRDLSCFKRLLGKSISQLLEETMEADPIDKDREVSVRRVVAETEPKVSLKTESVLLAANCNFHKTNLSNKRASPPQTVLLQITKNRSFFSKQKGPKLQPKVNIKEALVISF